MLGLCGRAVHSCVDDEFWLFKSPPVLPDGSTVANSQKLEFNNLSLNSRILKLSAWRGLLPWLPAIITLVLITAQRVNVPYFDSWAFMEAYREWQQGNYGLRDLFATHGPHPSVPGKLIYWSALHLTKGDVGWLPFAAWTFTFVAALGAGSMIKRCVPDDGIRSWLLFAANAILFTTAAGSTWIWDFCFQNFIMGMCLMGGLWSLSREAGARGILCAWLFAIVGTLSFGSGFIIGWLLPPMLWLQARAGRLQHSRLWIGTSVALALAMMWLAMVLLPKLSMAREQSQTAARAEDLVNRFSMTVKYLLVVLGGSLGHGTSVDPETLCALTAALAVGLFCVCLWKLWQRRQDHELLIKVWPWLACCLFAAGNTLLVALARMARSYTTALAPRYVLFTLFFMLGLIMLVALLMERRVTKIVLAVVLSLQVLNWVDGANEMRHFHHVLTQNRGALGFSKILPLEPDRVLQHRGPGSVANIALFLHGQGRLRGVQMLEDSRISSLRLSGDMTSKSAHVDLVARNFDGSIVMQGVCASSKFFGALPDLILVTAQEPAKDERIIAFQLPTMPVDFFNDSDRRHREEQHYEGWRIVLNQAPVPETAGTKLRAYGLNSETWRARRIPGEFAVPGK